MAAAMCCNDMKVVQAAGTMRQWKESKEKLTLFSNHNGSVLRQQPGACDSGIRMEQPVLLLATLQRLSPAAE